MQIQKYDFPTLQSFESAEEDLPLLRDLTSPLEPTPPPAPNPALADAPQEVATDPSPPTLTEEMAAALTKEAHAKGVAEGRAAALAEIDSQAAAQQASIKELLERLNMQLSLLPVQESLSDGKLHTELAEICFMVAKKVAGAALQADPMAEITHVLEHCLKTLRKEPSLTITVHSSLIAPLTEHLDTLKKTTSFSGQLIVHGSETLAATDCHIEWHNGAIEMEKETLWQEIEQLLKDCVPSIMSPLSVTPPAIEEPSTEEAPLPDVPV